MTAIDIVGVPVSDRLKLMETLWDSLCAHSGTGMELPAWHTKSLRSACAV